MSFSFCSGTISTSDTNSTSPEKYLQYLFDKKYNRYMAPSATDGKQPAHILFEAELLKRVDDFRFKHRFPNRAAAIKWLLDAALKASLAPEKGE